jgi:hypothetical protein
MVQPGRVTIGFATAEGAAANWDFQLQAEPGPNGLLAVGNGRMLLRRDIDITMPTTVPVVNLDDGVALASLPLTVNGTQSGDATTTRTYLFTGNMFTELVTATGAAAQLAPDAQLMAGDAQYISLSVDDGTVYRTAFTRHISAAPITTFDLLPRLSGVQFTGSSASWTTIPDGGRELYVFSGALMLHKFMSVGYAGTATTLAIDTNIPGFRPEWKPGTVDYRFFEVNNADGAVSLRTGIGQLGTATVAKRAHARRSKVEALRGLRTH